jgi:anti-sigma B factor antagonist
MQGFEVDVALAGNGSGDRLVTVRGELDLAAAPQLWESLEPVLLPGVLVVLDGTAMTFLDSSGLRVLLQAHKRAESDGAVFRLVAPEPAVQRVLDLAGADKYLQLRDDVSAALAG